ncbi:MAG: LacI family transcriptional regulator [Lachnospiraceae bacterium]|nr:LacI family transcriptional regulator [Lachnospiraceae bacterium]
MTIKDIAAKCGVSVSTVSRVLNNQPYVKQDVRDKVMKVIEEEHFVPHEGAVSLAKTQEDSFGVIIRGINNPFFSEMVTVILQRGHEMGYSTYLHQIRSCDDEIGEAASLAKSRKLKGVILLGGNFDRTEEEIRQIDVPIVCCTFTNKFGVVPKEIFSSVSIDDEAAAYKAVSYLISEGHKKIAVVLPSVDDKSISELRYMGYCKAMKEAGLAVTDDLIIATGDYSMEEAYAGVKAALERKAKFTAIFGISDLIALASMKALSDAGYKIPGKCSVIGIDGIDMTSYFIPTLTTLVQPRDVIAQRAVEILIGAIEEPGEGTHEIVEAQLRIGESVKKI